MSSSCSRLTQGLWFDPRVRDTEKVIEGKGRGRVQTDKNQESYFLKVYKNIKHK